MILRIPPLTATPPTCWLLEKVCQHAVGSLPERSWGLTIILFVA